MIYFINHCLVGVSYEMSPCAVYWTNVFKLTEGTFAGLVKTLLTKVLKLLFYWSSDGIDGIDGIMRCVN